jgi:hypothetical protein
VDADAGQTGGVDVAGEQLRGTFGWDGGAVGTGEDQIVILGVGGPAGAGGEPLFELASSVVLRDGLDGTGGDTWVETDIMSRMSGVRSCGRTRVRTATVPTA